MKNLSGLAIAALVLLTSAWACNFSTANLSSLKTTKDKDGSQATTTYKAGDTIYAEAAVANNPGKVTVRMYMTVDDAPGMKKGDMIPNSEVKIDLSSDSDATYNYPTYTTTAGGKFILTAELINEAGEKKDSKTAAITVEPGPASSSKGSASDDDK